MIIPPIVASAMRSAGTCVFFAASSPSADANLLKSVVSGLSLSWNCGVATSTFPPAALNLYGVYELQTLEDVLRNENSEAIATVARTIRTKADLSDDGDDYGFLADYYAALCAHLERGLMVGRRRESKFSE